MPTILKWSLIILCITKGRFINASAHVNNVNNNKAIHLADPTIFYYRDIYYLYGTVEGHANEGFLVYTSTDLKNWKLNKKVDDGYALRKGNVYGTENFWAPQVFFHNNRFYMAYVANENIAIAKVKALWGHLHKR